MVNGGEMYGAVDHVAVWSHSRTGLGRLVLCHLPPSPNFHYKVLKVTFEVRQTCSSILPQLDSES